MKIDKIIGTGLLIVLIGMMTVSAFAQQKGGSNVPQNELTNDEQQLVEKLKKKPLNGFFALTFTNAVPQNEFFDNVKSSAQGFSIIGGYDMEPIPVVFGGELDLLFYGGETRIFGYGPGDWKPYRDTVQTNSMMVPLNAFVKLQPNLWNLFYPYLEGIVGINFLSVSADLKTHWGDTDTKDRFSVSLNYGLGAGVQIKLVDFITLPNAYSQLLFNFGARYIRGTEVDFANVKINDDSSVTFDDFKTKTDYVTLLFGFSFRF
jgi:opacity protein-like surface antigen